MSEYKQLHTEDVPLETTGTIAALPISIEHLTITCADKAAFGWCIGVLWYLHDSKQLTSLRHVYASGLAHYILWSWIWMSESDWSLVAKTTFRQNSKMMQHWIRLMTTDQDRELWRNWWMCSFHRSESELLASLLERQLPDLNEAWHNRIAQNNRHPDRVLFYLSGFLSHEAKDTVCVVTTNVATISMTPCATSVPEFYSAIRPPDTECAAMTCFGREMSVDPFALQSVRSVFDTVDKQAHSTNQRLCIIDGYVGRTSFTSLNIAQQQTVSQQLQTIRQIPNETNAPFRNIALAAEIRILSDDNMPACTSRAAMSRRNAIRCIRSGYRSASRALHPLTPVAELDLQ